MKKVFLYMLLIAGMAAATSCSKNLPPVFDDANAFVAFDQATAGLDEAIIKEDGSIVPQTAVIKIPVTLGSVKGLTETVNFKVVDGTAKAGLNYKVNSSSTSLSFDATNRTQYVELAVIYDPRYTGDLKFTVELEPTQNVSLGYQSTCTVTVADVDHPMTPLLGTYTCKSSRGAYSNPWTIEIFKDEDDDHLIWIDNIFANPGWAIPETRFYGNVDETASTIVIPYGQTSEYKYGGSVPVTLYWSTVNYNGSAAESDSDDYSEHGKTGNHVVNILRDANGNVTGLEFDEEHGFVGFLETLGWIGFNKAKITATKD